MAVRLSFERWFELVDLEVERILGVSVHELSDFPSRDTYDSGATPAEGAQAALEDDDLVTLVFGDDFDLS